MDNLGSSHQFSRDEIQRQVFEKQQELQRLQALLQQQPQHSAVAFQGLPHQQSEHLVASIGSNQHDGVSLKRSRTYPRSHSTAGQFTIPSNSMTNQPSERHQPVKRSRVMSQQYSSSPAMASGMSRSTSTRSAKAMPFVARGPVAPLQTSSSTPNSAIDRYFQSDDDLSMSMHHSINRQQPQQRAELPRVEEHCTFPDVGMNPLDFLAAYDDGFSSSAPVAPLPQNYPVTFPDGHRRSNASYMTSGCPSMVSGPSAAEAADAVPLTRDNSSFDSQLVNSLEMARIESTQSHHTDFTDDNLYSLSHGNGGKVDELFAYTGASLSAPASQQYGSSLPTDQSLGFPVAMERSISSSSTQSSVERRAREARQRHNQNARKANLIMPKPVASAEATPAPPVKKEGKVAVSKNGPYMRPKHPKVTCDQCDDHPDGFRGEHELKRHVMAKHAGTVRKFVCRDPADVGIQSNVEAVNPLSKCKQCINKKQYGAYYNAAAHLRRTHFKPKTPRNKHKKGDDDEKRGGKGGGDWPPMNELKNWFEEIYVAVETTSLGAEDDDMEAYDDGNACEPYFSGIPASDTSFVMPADYSAMMPNLGMDASGPADNTMPMSAGLSGVSFDYSPYAQSPMTGISPDGTYTAAHAATMSPVTYQTFDEYAPFALEV